MVTAGANMAFMHAVFAITEPGDEIVLNVPFYFNHEMAIQMAGCVAVGSRRRALPAAARRAARGHHRSHARDRDGVAQQSKRRGVRRRGVARRDTLCRERGLYHIADDGTSTSRTDRRATSRRARSRRRSPTISMFSLSKAYGFAGWRIGYMTYPAPPRPGDGEEPGYDPRLPDRGGAGRRDRGARRRTVVLPPGLSPSSPRFAIS